MNERFFLKILLVLFCGLIAAEVLVVSLFGLKLELILLCFIVASALTGWGIRFVLGVNIPGLSRIRGNTISDRIFFGLQVSPCL